MMRHLLQKSEEVYIENHKIHKKESHVRRLKKDLYGPKKAPRA
jgi:hypothetical protein